jgi:acetyl esterase
LAGQVLMYPGMDGSSFERPSRTEFDGLILTRHSMEAFWARYTGGRDLDTDPGAVPLSAPSLAELPPAMVVLGGSDPLRDGGRAYATRLRGEGGDVEEVCFAGQPHGFINFELPAAAEALEQIGVWLRTVFGRS